MKDKRAKIHSLKNAPKPHDALDEYCALRGRHTNLVSEWCYSVWMAKMAHGMIHFKLDEIGEVWLMPGDNWQDVLKSMIGLPKESEL